MFDAIKPFRGLVAPVLTGLALSASAQLVDATNPAAVAAALAAARASAAQSAQSSGSAATPVGAPPPQPALPLPPDPATSAKPLVFGSQIFSGRFGGVGFNGFNADYQVAVGDRITVRMWGGFNFDAPQTVDAQGNIFLPNIGPIRLQGVRNGDLNRQVEEQVKRVFRASVGVYATLDATQPVRVYVTGFARAPGLYNGLSSDSVMHYIDLAGGVDPDRGSYLEVDVLRGGKPHAKVNLYKFLLEGQIESIQLHDGDTIVVPPRKHIVQIAGEVLNPYIFEFSRPQVSGAELLAMAQPRPGATHMRIARKVGVRKSSEYYPLGAAGQVLIQDGDEVNVTSDQYTGTILVHIEGAHLGERTLVLPYGAKLKDAQARLKPAPQANLAALQLFRTSVATRQKELLESSMRSLETYALTSRSATSEESALRQRESQMILDYINRARQIQPRGQVILAQTEAAGEGLLEDGDIIRLPAVSNLVLVSGEVMFPNAVVYDPAADVEAYVQRAGGYNQGADKAKLMVLRQDGNVAEGNGLQVRAGDEILVLPKIEAKSVEITRGITTILYQIAVAVRVAMGL